MTIMMMMTILAARKASWPAQPDFCYDDFILIRMITMMIIMILNNDDDNC